MTKRAISSNLPPAETPAFEAWGGVGVPFVGQENWLSVLS